MLENHTYANLFPVHIGRRHRKIRTIKAPPNEGDVQGGISNSRTAELRAMNYSHGKGYLMNRYTRPPFGSSAVTRFGARFDPDLRYLAHRYESATRNFQPVIVFNQPTARATRRPARPFTAVKVFYDRGQVGRLLHAGRS